MTTDLYQDAAFYEQLNRGYRDDLGFYLGLARDHGGPVLELGAGAGRVSMALARDGVQVVAVEPALAMRSLGEARSREAGLADAITWVDGDMRRLDLGRRFPLVIAPFHALMHLHTLDEQDAALRGALAHLEEGGAFATDVFVPSFGAQGLVRVEPGWHGLDDGDLLLWQHHDPLSQVIVTEHRWDQVGADGLLRRRSATLRQRYYHRFELERALRAAGFDRVRTFGGFDRGPVKPQDGSWCFLAYRR